MACNSDVRGGLRKKMSSYLCEAVRRGVQDAVELCKHGANLPG